MGWTQRDVLLEEGYTSKEVDLITDSADCEHGLSLSLCAGPNHYPDDSQDDFPVTFFRSRKGG